jgi:hypothetical protein
MCKILAAVTVAVAAILGILVNVLPAEVLPNIVFIPKFFEVVLPVLGAGALIKYLYTKTGCACCTKKD